MQTSKCCAWITGNLTCDEAMTLKKYNMWKIVQSLNLIDSKSCTHITNYWCDSTSRSLTIYNSSVSLDYLEAGTSLAFSSALAISMALAEHFRISCSLSKHSDREFWLARRQFSYALRWVSQSFRILMKVGTLVLTQADSFSCSSKHLVTSPPLRHLW